MGYLSTDGDFDVEWRKSKWTFGGFSDDVVDSVYNYCQHKVEKEGLQFIHHDEPALS